MTSSVHKSGSRGDIATVIGGSVVTESDLRDAHHAVDERIGPRQPRKRKRTLAGIAAAAVLTPILGYAALQAFGDQDRSTPPATDVPTSPSAEDIFLTGNPPTHDLVQGVWRVDNGVSLLRFGEDGSMQWDDRGALFHDPPLRGTYQLEGDLITVTATDGSSLECIGTEFVLRASLAGFGDMRVVSASSSSPGCAPIGPSERAVLHQVLPTNGTLADMEILAKGDWQPPMGPRALYGDWMAEVADSKEHASGRGGHLLEIAPNGSYVVAGPSGDVLDRGRWNLSVSPARLSLVSAADSPSCAPGDRLVLGQVEHEYSWATAMRGTVRVNECSGAWAPEEWLLLPHRGS
jgi:hypothetical protein